MGASHVEVEHVGEVEIRIEASSLGELYVEAARALMEVMSGGALAPARGPAETVTLRARDREALLVDWLNELIYRVERGRKIYSEFRLLDEPGEALTVELRGGGAPTRRTLVKAASFHGLAVAPVAGGWAATVLLDV
jgi:SHS2 domain-containing protein